MTEIAHRFLPRLAAAVALACSLLGWPLGALADPATITLGASAGENGTVSYEFQDAKGAVQFRLSKEVQKGETAKSVIDYFENSMKLFGALYKVTRSSETLPGELILYSMKIEPQGETPNFGKVVSKLPSGYAGTHSVDKKASGKAAIEVTPKAPGAPDAIVSGTWRFDLLDQDLNRLAFLTVVADEAADAFDVLRPFYDELASLDFDPLLASAGEGGASLSLLSQDNLFFGVGHDDTRFALSMSDELLVPEPSTLSLAVLGVVLALLARGRSLLGPRAWRVDPGASRGVRRMGAPAVALTCVVTATPASATFVEWDGAPRISKAPTTDCQAVATLSTLAIEPLSEGFEFTGQYQLSFLGGAAQAACSVSFEGLRDFKMPADRKGWSLSGTFGALVTATQGIRLRQGESEVEAFVNLQQISTRGTSYRDVRGPVQEAAYDGDGTENFDFTKGVAGDADILGLRMRIDVMTITGQPFAAGGRILFDFDKATDFGYRGIEAQLRHVGEPSSAALVIAGLASLWVVICGRARSAVGSRSARVLSAWPGPRGSPAC